jgi:DNA-binding transcriptional MerR regulator
MLRIGDFARMGRISVKTLRYYDEVGLLEPAEVDRMTGYRFYSADQLLLLNRILVYKALGFSLAEIRRLIDRGLSPAQLRELLDARRAELEAHVAAEWTQLAEMEARISQIELEGNPPAYDIRITDSAAYTVVSLRRVIPRYAELAPLLREIDQLLPHKAEIECHGAIWHHCNPESEEIDCEALAVLRQPVAAPHGCCAYLLAPATVAAVLHDDREDPFPRAYGAVLDRIRAGGYEIRGPMRELYFAADGRSAGLTEVQFPIQRAAHLFQG